MGRPKGPRALVLAGGEGRRMGADKALLRYGEATEVDRLWALLTDLDLDPLIGCRADQAALPGRRGRPQVHDRPGLAGPLASILAAQDAFPDTPWVVVACDLPLLERPTLEALLAGRDPRYLATAFRGDRGFPEPLCALYEAGSHGRLAGFVATGIDCPRKALIHSPTHLLDLPDPRALANANTPADRQEVLNDLGR